MLYRRVHRRGQDAPRVRGVRGTSRGRASSTGRTAADERDEEALNTDAYGAAGDYGRADVLYIDDFMKYPPSPPTSGTRLSSSTGA